ncbi:MAG: YkvA family protein [Chloroflexi bacterium]|nr:YkvA family protein [Chloroflexota bacterium]MDA1175230.1 YkvA family protein [Chloroflexota bacterium]
MGDTEEPHRAWLCRHQSIRQAHQASARHLAQRAAAPPHASPLPKALLWFAIAYALMPFDLIPDFIPLLGWLDDLVFVAVPIAIAIKLVPADIIAECRAANPPPALNSRP